MPIASGPSPVEHNGRIVAVVTCGKVGSTSTVRALQQALHTDEMPHCHHIALDCIERNLMSYERAGRKPGPIHAHALAIRRWLVDEARPASLISIVRNPLARNLSMLTHMLRDAERHGIDLDKARDSEAGLRGAYRVLRSKQDISFPLRWFDEQIRFPLDIRVYDEPFGHDTHQQVVHDPEGRIRMLILRAEDPDETKGNAIDAFLGLPSRSVLIARDNELSSKPYADIGRAVRRIDPFAPEDVEHMLTSPMTRHFYTPDEITRFREDWAQRYPD